MARVLGFKVENLNLDINKDGYIFYSLNIRILFLNFGKIIFFFLIIPGIYYNSQITYISLMSLFCINTYIIRQLDTRHHQSSSLKPLAHPLHVFHKYKFDNFIDLKWLAISSPRRGNKHINQYHDIKQNWRRVINLLDYAW